MRVLTLVVEGGRGESWAADYVLSVVVASPGGGCWRRIYSLISFIWEPLSANVPKPAPK